MKSRPRSRPRRKQTIEFAVCFSSFSVTKRSDKNMNMKKKKTQKQR